MDVSGGSVEFSTCDGAATQVWRGGPDGTLVNASLKQCLTDPDSDSSPGTGLDVAACTDGANQQWIFAGD
jgi:non-reducing end alpha-L-arabinofuranosidase